MRVLGLRVDAAGEEARLDRLPVEVAPDEDHLGDALLPLGPLLAALLKLDLLVHALEDVLCVALVGEGEHALGAVEVLLLLLEQVDHEAVEKRRVERVLREERERAHARDVVLALLGLGRRAAAVGVGVALLDGGRGVAVVVARRRGRGVAVVVVLVAVVLVLAADVSAHL